MGLGPHTLVVLKATGVKEWNACEVTVIFYLGLLCLVCCCIYFSEAVMDRREAAKVSTQVASQSNVYGPTISQMVPW